MSTDASLAVGEQHATTGGFGGALRAIVRADGPTGLFRGLSAFAPRVIVASAVQLSTYDIVKEHLVRRLRLDPKSVSTHAAASMVTGVAVVLAMQPFDFAATLLVNSLSASEQGALAAAARVLGAQTLLRVGNASGPRLYRKAGQRWSSPAGHAHPLERSIEPASCAVPPRGGGGRAGAVEVSDLVIAAIPVGDPRPKKPRGPVELPGCPATFLSQAHPNAGTYPVG